MTRSTIFYFGYGSLVNRQTRPHHEPAVRARLHGFKRHWAHRVVNSQANRGQANRGQANRGQANRGQANQGPAGSGCTSLTVVPCDDSPGAESALDGVLVPIAEPDLPELDAREAGYDRCWIPMSQLVIGEPTADFTLPDFAGVGQVAVYQSQQENCHPADAAHPILQSYVDCVMAGYLALFGEQGLGQFMTTTDGWHRPIENDRAAPRYPRAGFVDTGLFDHFDAQVERLKSQTGTDSQPTE